MIKNLPAEWDRLEQTGTGVQVHLHSNDAAVPLWIGIESITARRFCYLACETSASYSKENNDEANNIELWIEPANHQSQCQIKLILKEPSLNTSFDLLIDFLWTQLAGASSEQEAVSTFIEIYAKLKILFEPAKAKYLSRSNQIGLWGELWVLNEMMIPNLGLKQAVNAWTGPFGKEQDFQANHLNTEVKSSASKSMEKVRINGELQLWAEDNPLVLTTVHLREHKQGASLPMLIQEITGQLGFQEQLLFRAALAKYGYYDEHASRYVKKYNLFSEHTPTHFLVTQNFPRITPITIPGAISNIRYDLSLLSIDSFAIEETELTSLLRGEYDR